MGPHPSQGWAWARGAGRGTVKRAWEVQARHWDSPCYKPECKCIFYSEAAQVTIK